MVKKALLMMVVGVGCFASESVQYYEFGERIGRSQILIREADPFEKSMNQHKSIYDESTRHQMMEMGRDGMVMSNHMMHKTTTKTSKTHRTLFYSTNTRDYYAKKNRKHYKLVLDPRQ